MIERMPNESELSFHKRLVYGKIVNKTLADIDYTELAEQVYGKPYSSDVARRMMYGSCKTLQLIDANTQESASNNLLAEIRTQQIELQKERQKFYDQRAAYNKIVRERARQEELNEILSDAIMHGDLPQLCYVPNDVSESDNDLLVSLNDIHFGAVVDNYWNRYNSDVCRREMWHYLDRIIHIQKTHGSENCIVWQNGDSISGNIHHSIAVTNKENVIEQITGVSELIAEFIAELSQHFKSVSYVSVAGNHSRINPDKDKTTIHERLDDLVEWYLKARLSNFNNVIIGDGLKIDATMYQIDIRGKTYLGVHGDYEGSDTKVSALCAMSDKQPYAILMGHKHHNKIDEVNGVKTIMAGSFLGVDDFCVQKRIVGHAEQMVCVCDENGIRCSYDIPLR